MEVVCRASNKAGEVMEVKHVTVLSLEPTEIERVIEEEYEEESLTENQGTVAEEAEIEGSADYLYEDAPGISGETFEEEAEFDGYVDYEREPILYDAYLKEENFAGKEGNGFTEYEEVVNEFSENKEEVNESTEHEEQFGVSARYKEDIDDYTEHKEELNESTDYKEKINESTEYEKTVNESTNDEKSVKESFEYKETVKESTDYEKAVNEASEYEETVNESTDFENKVIASTEYKEAVNGSAEHEEKENFVDVEELDDIGNGKHVGEIEDQVLNEVNDEEIYEMDDSVEYEKHENITKEPVGYEEVKIKTKEFDEEEDLGHVDAKEKNEYKNDDEKEKANTLEKETLDTYDNSHMHENYLGEKKPMKDENTEAQEGIAVRLKATYESIDFDKNYENDSKKEKSSIFINKLVAAHDKEV